MEFSRLRLGCRQARWWRFLASSPPRRAAAEPRNIGREAGRRKGFSGGQGAGGPNGQLARGWLPLHQLHQGQVEGPLVLGVDELAEGSGFFG